MPENSKVGDRFSDLPTEILHQILDLLPFEEQVRTAVLSTRWRRLWCTNSVLRLDGFKCSPDQLLSIVNNCLQLCSGLKNLQSLTVPVPVPVPLSDNAELAPVLPRWLRFAADRSVAELVLRPFYYVGPRVAVPSDLFDCRLLSFLKIEQCSFASVPSDARLYRLKTLVLYRVNICSDALHALLSLCPSIEHVTLRSCKEVSRVAIVSLTMKSLAVDRCDSLQLFEIISAPRLRILIYFGDILIVRSLEGAPNLEEATLFSFSRRPFRERRRWREFLSSIARARVKILCVNCWFFEFSLDDDSDFGSRRAVFKNLRELHWRPTYKKPNEFIWSCECFKAASLRALISTLRDCPSLELLCIHRDLYWQEDGSEEVDEEVGERHWWMMKLAMAHGLPPLQFDDTWTDPLGEFEGDGYSLPQLKRFKLIPFSDTRVERRMVEFLLDKAVALDSVILYYQHQSPENLSWLKTVISAMRKASPVVCTSLSELPYDPPCSQDEVPCPQGEAMLWSRCMYPHKDDMWEGF